MPTWHRSQYQHNYALYTELRRCEYPDWAVTVLFYAVLQLVDEVLEQSRGTPPVDHYDRDRAARAMPATKPVSEAYVLLRSLSERARYKRSWYELGDTLEQAELLFTEVQEHLLSQMA